MKGDQITRDPNQIESFVGQALLEAFNKFPSDYHQMMAAAKGNKDIQYVPKRAATRFTREQFKEEKYQYTVSSMDAPIQVKGNEGSDLTRKDTMSNPNDISQIDQLIEILENTKIRDQLNTVRTLLKNPSDLTTRQKQVFSMRHFSHNLQILDESEQPTFKLIATELRISKWRAVEIYTQAKSKILRHLNNNPI